MDDINKLLTDRYYDFWTDIYNIEKDEIKKLKKYIDYVQENLRSYKSFSIDYEGISSLFINKHLDYLEESFSSIVLGNYNAFSCLMRIIIENYVSLVLIKKYKKEYIFKDWYLWSYYIQLKKISDEDYQEKLNIIYKDLCEKLNVKIDYITNTQPYGWLKRVIRLPRYTFKNISELVDDEIYQDFSYLSGYIHNNDMYAKMNWVDMTLLTKFLFLLFTYTENLIKIYKPNIIRRVAYNDLKNDFL